MESLTPEVAPFGICTTLVEPRFFRAELLTLEPTNYAESTIADYAERTKQTVTAWSGMNGLQGGDPAKLAKALIHLAGQHDPPRPIRIARARRGRACREWAVDRHARIDQRYLPLSNSYTYPSTGASVYAYIIDTGLQPGHPDFGGRAVGVSDPCGGNGNHGTDTLMIRARMLSQA